MTTLEFRANTSELNLPPTSVLSHSQIWRQHDRAWAAWTYETVTEAIGELGDAGTFFEVLRFFAFKRQALAKAYRNHEAELFGVWRDENLAAPLRTRTTFFGPTCPRYDKAALAYHALLGLPHSSSIEGVIRARLGNDTYELTSFKCDVHGQDPRDRMWIHTHWRNVRPILNHCRELFEMALEPVSASDAMAIVAELHWWFVHALPFARGSTSIAEWLVSYIFRMRGVGGVRFFEDPASLALVAPNHRMYRGAFEQNIEMTPTLAEPPVMSAARRLTHAARVGNRRQVSALLKRMRADVVEPTGYTPLHLAARQGHPKIVKWLLQAGAPVDVSHVDSGETPLHLAARQGHTAVIKLLLAANASLDAPDLFGSTAVHLAAREHHGEALHCLVRHGAAVGGIDQLGRLPLHYAAERGYRTLVALLVAASHADINTADRRGETPLSLAALHGHTRVVHLLVKHGARPPRQNAHLLTLTVGHTEADRRALEGGVDPSWYRLLLRTAARGHRDAFKLLAKSVLHALPRNKRAEVAALFPQPTVMAIAEPPSRDKNLEGLSAVSLRAQGS